MTMNRMHTWGAAALLFAGLVAQAIAQPMASKIKVENLTKFDTPSVQQAIVENATKDFSEHLAQGKYALWMLVDRVGISATGKNFCVAIVGLTRPAPDDRHARIPASRTATLVLAEKRGKISADEWNECKSQVLVNAIKGFSRDSDWNALARQADEKTSPDGTRKREPADSQMVFVARYGTAAPTESVEVPSGFSAAFDYRELEIVAVSAAFAIDGERVCYATAGVAAKSPANRHSRLPAFRGAMLGTGDLNDKSGKLGTVEAAACELEITNDAVASVLKNSWDQNGLLKGLAMTREDGVALVTHAKKSRPAAPSNVVNTTVHARNVLSCHNECMNGSCVRTFGNGRKENWQAPRVFNPATNDWEWQTNSCGN